MIYSKQSLLGPSGLTSDALRKHDAVQSFVLPKPESVRMEADSESSIGTQTTYQTMQSFASEWTDCSNMSYNRFLNVFRSDSALHKEMLAILAAVTEVIKENNGTESSTEYFCALVIFNNTFFLVKLQLIVLFVGNYCRASL